MNEGQSERQVLLVDCNVALRNGIEAWFRHEFPGCRIYPVADGATARILAAECSPAVALVNVDGRRNHGFETLRALRIQCPGITLVALSLYQTDYFLDAATIAGADACACVALADDHLRDLLRRVLPRHDGQLQ